MTIQLYEHFYEQLLEFPVALKIFLLHHWTLLQRGLAWSVIDNVSKHLIGCRTLKECYTNTISKQYPCITIGRFHPPLTCHIPYNQS